AHSGQEDGELRDARNMVRVKRPADEGAGEEERGESHRAAPVAPPEAQVSPGDEPAGDDQEEKNPHGERLADCLRPARAGKRRPRPPGPGPGELETDR